MGRIVLNHRESRITIVEGWVLPPAEVPHPGAKPVPSRTKFTDKQMAKVNECQHTQHLFEVGYLALGEQVPDKEPEKVPDAPPPAADPVPEKRK
jgi:hypothetical protein